MITTADVIAEARTWLGTPYHHQARAKGVGVDCAGLIIGVARDLGITDVDYTGYGRQPHEGQLRATVERHLIRTEQCEPGCVLLMGFLIGPSDEQHLGILTGEGTIIHAYELAGCCVEHRYASAWRTRTRGLYRYPGVV